MIIVVSGPGGVGKGTVVEALVAAYPNDFWLSRSWTTRKKRNGESNECYNFVSRELFEERISQGGFIEYTEFLGNYYGSPTPDAPAGRHIILEIEVDGASQIKEKHPSAFLIFLEAPSREEQLRRLQVRGDSAEKIEQRVQKATQEADAGRELGASIIVNHDIDSTVEEMWELIQRKSNQTETVSLDNL